MCMQSSPEIVVDLGVFSGVADFHYTAFRVSRDKAATWAGRGIVKIRKGQFTVRRLKSR
jgi:hypothetical protein